MVSLILGSVSFTGSLIAMGKLQGKIKDIRVKKSLAFFVFGLAIAVAAYILYAGVPNSPLIYVVLIISLIYGRSEEHTSELQSRENLVCRLLLEKKKKDKKNTHEKN